MDMQTFEESSEAISTAERTTSTMTSVAKSEQVLTAEVNTTNKPLKECVLLAMKNYYTRVEGSNPSDIYTMVLKQVEPPLLETTMKFTQGNQSKAAILLGISRGTLRKKLKEYGFS